MIFFILNLFIEPPKNVKAVDNPNDGGSKIFITWELSPSDSILDGYEILRKGEKEDTFYKIGFVGQNRNQFVDEKTIDGINYCYQVVSVKEPLRALSAISEWARSYPQWFHKGKLIILFTFFILSFLILYFIKMARKTELFIRRIPGLTAVEEAVGRATEMGKPVLFVPGISGMGDVATIAALNILGEVAKKIAQYDVKLIVPNADPIVYTVAREVVKEAYTSVGRHDGFNPDSVFYLTDSQFAYAAGVDGIMVREKPATNFLCGYFAAESLILAETGASTGAIQIAGTDSITQLPFFVVACDYTLIGEELYAASAYLSKEPTLLGSLKGQDYGKLLIIIFLIIASIFVLIFNFVIR